MPLLSMREFEDLVRRVMETLPLEFTPYLDNLVVEVAKAPDRDLLLEAEFTEEEIANGDSLFGLFEPVELTDFDDEATLMHRLRIFRDPHEEKFRDLDQLKIEIRKTVIHELAHHFGFEEDDLERFDNNPNPFGKNELTPAAETIELDDGGELKFYRAFLAYRDASQLFRTLRDTISWRQEAGLFGHPAPRLTAWFSDPGIYYRYSGNVHEPTPWPAEILALKSQIETVCQKQFNSVLLNYYRDGNDSMGYHSDDEKELGPNPVIASVSLGGSRRFLLKHKTSGERRELKLTHGSLLIMGGTCQHYWKHSIPKTKKPTKPRINLTFRHIISNLP